MSFWYDKDPGEKIVYIILIGLVAAPLLYLAAFLIEFLICFCTCKGANYNCTIPIWKGAYFGYTFLFLSGAGIVIGIVYAIAVQVQKRNEAHDQSELEERVKYASEFKKEHSNAMQQSDKLKKMVNNTRLTYPKYESIDLQKNIWDALEDASTALQKLDRTVTELREKRG